MRCVIVDDEIPAREELKYLLSNLGNIHAVGEAGDGRTALELIEKLDPDMVFLDIQMRGMSGFDIANKLQKLEYKPLIVFITAYDKYAIEAFEVNAIDYLLKPVSLSRLQKTIEKIQAYNTNNSRNREIDLSLLLEYMNKPKVIQKICVYSNGKHIPLDPEDVVFAYVEGRSTIIKSKKGEYHSNYNLVELEDRLKSNRFFRCHRSYLININEIAEIDNGFNGTFEVVLRGYPKERIPVSRNNAQTFKSLMNI